MEDQMIQNKFQKAQKDSIRYGRCYILSNGKDLQTAITYEFVDRMKEAGYWVAAIFEHGYQVDL